MVINSTYPLNNCYLYGPHGTSKDDKPIAKIGPKGDAIILLDDTFLASLPFALLNSCLSLQATVITVTGECLGTVSQLLYENTFFDRMPLTKDEDFTQLSCGDLLSVTSNSEDVVKASLSRPQIKEVAIFRGLDNDFIDVRLQLDRTGDNTLLDVVPRLHYQFQKLVLSPLPPAPNQTVRTDISTVRQLRQQSTRYEPIA